MRPPRDAAWIAFERRVAALVAAIPRGRVTTYGLIAAALGDPRKAREVGWVLYGLPDGHDLPAHRVVNREGRLSGAWAFAHPELQHDRLVEDGVSFLPDGRVDLAQHLWEPPPASGEPLTPPW